MKTTALLSYAVLLFAAQIHAVSESCSNGVTVIDGSVSCSDLECTITCGGKVSKVAGKCPDFSPRGVPARQLTSHDPNNTVQLTVV